MRSQLRSLFVVLNTLLFACAAIIVIAQTGGPINRRPAPPTVNGPLKVETPKTDRKAPEIVASAGLPEDIPYPLPPHTILVRIRYKQELGYNDDHDTSGDKGPFSCAAFQVRATVLERGAPGTSGVEKRVGSIQPHEPMRAGDGLYSCWFDISDLPFRQAVNISGSVRDGPRYLRERWMGGQEPQPPSGYIRTVLGSQSVTLTSQQPSALVDMEMVYRPVPTPPR
jgi:hypothetical protein